MTEAFLALVITATSWVRREIQRPWRPGHRGAGRACGLTDSTCSSSAFRDRRGVADAEAPGIDGWKARPAHPPARERAGPPHRHHSGRRRPRRSRGSRGMGVTRSGEVGRSRSDRRSGRRAAGPGAARSLRSTADRPLLAAGRPLSSPRVRVAGTCRGAHATLGPPGPCALRPGARPLRLNDRRDGGFRAHRRAWRGPCSCSPGVLVRPLRPGKETTHMTLTPDGFLAFTASCSPGTPAHAQSLKGKKVLFVNSYHEGYEWSDGIARA